MRWTRPLTSVLAIAGAACGGGADDGALLTIRAPLGPTSTARLEVVLANANADRIARVDHQRVTPFGIEEVGALYFQQRDTAGEVLAIAELDGFVLQIAPNAERREDTTFVPFLIAHDDQDVITGIATVLDGNGEPLAVTVEDGKLVQYVADMSPLVQVDGENAVLDGDAFVVGCASRDTPFESGIAWQPATGAQLRLMLPDPSIDADDASTRDLDLDCDGVLAPVGDCDDLRADFFDGAEESCDGRDTDCDAQRLEPLPCELTVDACGTGNTGVAVCIDRGLTPQPGMCTAPPSCQCSVGGPPPCNRCILDFKEVDPQTAKPCAPSVGVLKFANFCAAAATCHVEVVADPNSPWETLLSADGDNFSTRLDNVDQDVFLMVKPRVDDVFPGAAGRSVGEVFLHVDTGVGSGQIGIDLELTAVGPTDACGFEDGIAPMQCD